MGSIFSSKSIRFVLAFQVLFFILQFFVFYPCLVGVPSQNDVHVDTDYKRSVDFVKEMTVNEVKKSEKHVSFGKFQPTWESLESRPLPNWYDEGKIGIFIHWGVYSVPGFVDVGHKGLAEWFWWYWKGKVKGESHIKNQASVTKFMKNNYPPGFDYTDFAPQFKAEFFKPDNWSELFKASGARYVVLTSKHHDGFPLWPSKWSWNWNAMDNGPHRDLVGDLATSVRNKGLRFGLYHSLYEWFNPLYLEDKRNNFKTQTYVKAKLMPELTDMVMRYKPEVVWSDGHWDAPCSYWNCTQFIAWLYNDRFLSSFKVNWQLNLVSGIYLGDNFLERQNKTCIGPCVLPVKETVVTNDRWGIDVSCKHGGYLTCMDRWVPEKTERRKWENCMTIDKESWGYRRNADVEDYFNMDELTKILVETVSKGGNLLMNVGPTADGRIAPLFQERLTELGQWLKVNGEGIYGTKPWKYDKDPTCEGVWYTSKETDGKPVIYAIVLDFLKEWNGVIRLTAPASITTSNTEVKWLGYSGQIKWQLNNGFEIHIPRLFPHEMPCEWAWTFKIENIKV